MVDMAHGPIGGYIERTEKVQQKRLSVSRIRTNLKILRFIVSRELSEKVGTISFLRKNRKNVENRMSVTKCTLQFFH